MKLFKLAWDMHSAPNLAGRHQQYEKFYAGASFIAIRNHSFRETDWSEFGKLVDDLMAAVTTCRPNKCRVP